jgi:hypothetical protein
VEALSPDTTAIRPSALRNPGATGSAQLVFCNSSPCPPGQSIVLSGSAGISPETAELPATGAENAVLGCEAVCRLRATFGSGRRCRSRVEGAQHAPTATVQDMGVDHGGADVMVAQQLLDGADVVARLEPVGRALLRDARPERGRLPLLFSLAREIRRATAG